MAKPFFDADVNVESDLASSDKEKIVRE